jgi:HEAT repeat protein
MIYRDDDGIRLERHSSPDGAAVFLLTDVTSSRPVIKRVKTLDINEPYLFENRPVYWLGNVDASQSLAELESAIRANAEDKTVARGATHAIGEHDSPRVVPLLKEMALKQTDTDLRRSAVSSLSRVGTKDSLDALDELFAATSDLQLKQAIVRGYSYAGDRTAEKRVLDRLTTIAQSDPQVELRREALRRIASFKGDAVSDRLFQIYDQSNDRDTRLEILKRVAGGDSGNERSIKRLIAIAKTGTDAEFQRTAIRRLSPDASAEQMQALIEIYDSAASDPVKEEVINKLAQSTNSKAKDKLVGIAKNDQNSRLRQAAVRRLSGSRAFSVN